MATVTLTQQGQITIPAEVRRELNLQPGAKLQVRADTEAGLVTLQKKPTIDDVRSYFASVIDPQIPPLLDPGAYYREHRFKDAGEEQ